MKTTYFALSALLALTSACGKPEPASNDSVPATGKQADQGGQVYSGGGTIQSIAGDQVAIAHGPIEGIGWSAMTMTFTAPPDLTESAQIGSQVEFSFHKDGSTYVLTSLRKR